MVHRVAHLMAPTKGGFTPSRKASTSSSPAPHQPSGRLARASGSVGAKPRARLQSRRLRRYTHGHMRSTFMKFMPTCVADRTPQVRLHIHVKRRSMPASNECNYTLMRAADSPSSQAEGVASSATCRVQDPPRPSAPACISPFRRDGSRTGSRRRIRRQSPGRAP